MGDSSLDVFFDVLADARRRDVLAHLGDNGGAASRDELVDAVAAHERLGRGRDVRENVALSLHHGHLPKLEQAGLTVQTADRVLLTERGEAALETLSTGVAGLSDD